MRYIDKSVVLDFLRQVRVEPRVIDGFAQQFNTGKLHPRSRGNNTQLGILPNEYGSESNDLVTPQDYALEDVFRGGSGAPVMPAPPAPFAYANVNSFSLVPFSTGLTSITVLPANLQRTILIAQNLDASANMFINFDNGASPTVGVKLGPGGAVIFDVICPNNSISAAFDTTGSHFGIMAQAQRAT